MSTYYVNTASTPGGDGSTNGTSGTDRAFASLDESFSTIATNQNEDVYIYCCGTAADNQNAVYDRNLAGSSNWVRVYGNPDVSDGEHPGYWSDSHYRIVGNGTGTPALYVGAGASWQTNIQFHWIQVKTDLNHDAVYISQNISGNTYGYLFSCIINKSGGTGAAVRINGSNFGAYSTVHNCVIRGNASASIGLWDQSTYYWTTVYNSVIYGFTGGQGIRVNNGSGHTSYVVNNIVFNNNDDFLYPNNIDYFYNNASDDGEGNNPVSISNWDDEFFNPDYEADLDFRLVETSNLLAAGVGRNVHSGVPLEDIIGDIRDLDNPSVGPYENPYEPPVSKKLDYRFINFATVSGFEDDGSHGIQIKVGDGLILDSSGVSLDTSTINQMYIQEYTIQAADMTSKSITLTTPLADTDQVGLVIFGGPNQNYGTDFTATNSTTLSWNGLGMDGSIAENDVIRLKYPK